MEEIDSFTPKTWPDYAAALLQTCAEVYVHVAGRRKLSAQPVETLSQRVLQLDQSLSENIEATVRQFSRNKTWKALTPEEAICISLRLNNAFLLACLLAELSTGEHQVKIPTAPDCSEEEVIYEWLLITMWNVHGRQRVESMIQSILHVMENTEE